MRWWYLGALGLVASNCVPLVGVLYLGWSLDTVMVLFWLDNVVFGCVAITRVRLARRNTSTHALRPPSLEERESYAAKIGFGYFFFTLIHGMFVLLLFGSRGMNVGALATGVAALIASRGVDFYFDYWRPKAYETADASTEAFTALVRVIVLHLVLVIGGLLIASLRAPLAALVLLVLFKIVADLVLLHYGRHDRPAAQAGRRRGR